MQNLSISMNSSIIYSILQLNAPFPSLILFILILPEELNSSLFCDSQSIPLCVAMNCLGKPAVKYIGNMHGNEVAGRELLLQLATFVCESYGHNELVSLMLRRTRIFLMPSMNPDGWLRSFVGLPLPLPLPLAIHTFINSCYSALSLSTFLLSAISLCCCLYSLVF